MAMHLDHYQLSARNIYETAHKLREETRLGFYDGGYFPDAGLASKIFPLGAGAYLAVEGVIDAGKIQTAATAKAFHDRTAMGDCFSLLSMRVDRIAELEAIAARHKTAVVKRPVVRIRPDGPPVEAFSAPAGASQQGRVNWYCHEKRINHHPAGQPVHYWPGLIEPRGVAWLEVGGSEQNMADWLGVPPAQFPYRYNGKAHGLYAIGVRTDRGDVEIRRPWRV